MREPKYWIGQPENCELCGAELSEIFIDGALNTEESFPKWAIMCPECFSERGVGLGGGKGQAYDAETKLMVAGDPDDDTEPFANIRNIGKCPKCGTEIKVGRDYWSCSGCGTVRVWTKSGNATNIDEIIRRLSVD